MALKKVISEHFKMVKNDYLIIFQSSSTLISLPIWLIKYKSLVKLADQ